MAVLIALAVATFAFGVYFFLRGQHTMHQVLALILFLISAVFLATTFLVSEVRKLIPRRRSAAPSPAPAPEAGAAAETSTEPRQDG